MVVNPDQITKVHFYLWNVFDEYKKRPKCLFHLMYLITQEVSSPLYFASIWMVASMQLKNLLVDDDAQQALESIISAGARG